MTIKSLTILASIALLTPAIAYAQSGEGWRSQPLARGDWIYRQTGDGSIAQFGRAPASPEAIVRCSQSSRMVTVSRAGSSPAVAMAIRTTFGDAQWAATVSGGMAQAIRPASDPVLDKIAFSRGRFAVDVPGAPPLILPAWAEISRVIEDCRG